MGRPIGRGNPRAGRDSKTRVARVAFSPDGRLRSPWAAIPRGYGM